jgi:hypothetical protein
MPSFSRWLSVLGEWTTGALQLTSSISESTMKNIRKSMQKSIGSSWISPPLSKIIPYASNSLRHAGALKVLLTLRGWVPSPPMPSGAHASLKMKTMMMSDHMHDLIAMGDNSEGEVMKQLLSLVMSDD